MLAFTDESLARVFIAATRIPGSKRGRFLQEIAARFDPPSRSPNAQRQAEARARWRNGVRVYRLRLRDVAVEGLITMMIADGQLTESEALDHRAIEAKLAALLEAQGREWAR